MSSAIGVNPDETKLALMRYTFDYVELRLHYHVDLIKKSFDPRFGNRRQTIASITKFEQSLQRVRAISSRLTDDHGLEYDIPCSYNFGQLQRSRTVESGETLARITDNALTLFKKVQNFGLLDDAATHPRVESLLEITHEFQIDVHGRVSIKASFGRCFPHTKGPKVRRAFFFMGRIYRTVLTFIEAAENIPSLRCITPGSSLSEVQSARKMAVFPSI